MNFRYGYVLHCPKCTESTVLLRQNPSETDEGLRYRPTGIGEIPFVCRKTEQSGFFCPEATLEEVYEHSPRVGSLSAWMIECECDHNNCGRPTDIFAIFDANGEPDQLIEIVLKISPTIPCTSAHGVQLAKATMKASKLRW